MLQNKELEMPKPFKLKFPSNAWHQFDLVSNSKKIREKFSIVFLDSISFLFSSRKSISFQTILINSFIRDKSPDLSDDVSLELNGVKYFRLFPKHQFHVQIDL